LAFSPLADATAFLGGGCSLTAFLVVTTICLVSCSEGIEQYRFALASLRGDINLVKQLIGSNKVNINATNGEIGPALVCASYGGHKEIVELLLEKGANIEIRDEKGTTALMNATIAGEIEIVKILLKNGANPKTVVITEKGEKSNTTAMTIAQMKNYKEIEFLLERAVEK